MRLAGLIAALVVSAGLWLFARGGGASSQHAPAYCRDVDRLSVALAGAGQGGGEDQAARLTAIGTALTRDGSALAQEGSVAAASVTALAADVTQWRTAILSNDAVDQTIALDRTLSDVSSVPGC